MSDNTAIRDLPIDIPQAAIDDLHDRLTRTRWPEPTPEADWNHGVPLAHLRELATYWRDRYDWRAAEAELNAIPGHVTEIDGQPIHFLHARSPEPDAMPLMLLHGYPSSVVEFLDVIGPLTDPRAHGGDPADAFHVVAPSLPGFGLSTPLTRAGWELGHTTDAFAELMDRLGYGRYAAHGGDIGAGVAGRLAAVRPGNVIATHVASDRGALGLAGETFPIPGDLSDAERADLQEIIDEWSQERGYLVTQSTRPQTIAYALTDSPVGQLAWIAEKFQSWTNQTAKIPEEAVGRDRLLTNISLYWFTRSGASAARFLYETAHGHLDWIASSDVPQGWSVFNTDPLLRRIMNPQGAIPFWRDHERGGHFPALECPDLLITDLRDFLHPHHP